MKLSACAIVVTTASFFYQVGPVYAEECNPKTSVTAIISTSTNRGDLARAIDRFEDLFTGLDNGFGDADTIFGFRTISFEEERIPESIADDTFHKAILKGLEFVRKPNQSYLVDDNLFSDINAEASKDFTQFSGKNMMASRGSDTISLVFHEVDNTGDGAIAGTRGFGVVFVDVDLAKQSKLVVKDKTGCVIWEAFAEPKDKGFSFVGIYVDDFSIFSVDIVTPSDIDGKTFGGGRRRRFGAKPPVDFIAFDNFVYGEPHNSTA